MTIKLNEHQAVAIAQLREALTRAAHGIKGDLVRRCAEQIGASVPTVHRWLKANAIEPSARTRRSDAGTSAASYDDLKLISIALYESIRKTGNRIMTIPSAIEMLQANGVIQTRLSPSRIAQLLTANGLHPSQLDRPTPAIAQRSLHPNHVWQVDASVCVAYYLSNATGLHVMREEEFYKNKPKNLTRVQNERLIRYTVVDHFSHALVTRYYLGSESAVHLGDVLAWAFSDKGSGHSMHGVPLIMQMDMGSANTSAPVQNMLHNLRVRVIVHERHNSRANGSVEVAHYLVERHFESALRFAHVDGLDDLNAKALQWAHHFCATRVHTRISDTRYSAWLRITADQLRIAPPVDVMRELTVTHPQERRVSNNLTITFAPLRSEGSREFSLYGRVPGVRAGDKVRVVVNVYRRPAIDVEYFDVARGEQRWAMVEPNEHNDAGFLVTAPVIGQDLRQGPRSLVDHNRDEGLLTAYGHAVPLLATRDEQLDAAKTAKEKGGLVFGGQVDPFRHVADAELPRMLPKRGVELEAQSQRHVDVPRLTIAEACMLISDGCKRVGAEHAFGSHVYGWLDQRFGADGVPDDQIEALCEQLIANAALPDRPALADVERPQLRAVGGGDA